MNRLTLLLSRATWVITIALAASIAGCASPNDRDGNVPSPSDSSASESRPEANSLQAAPTSRPAVPAAASVVSDLRGKANEMDSFTAVYLFSGRLDDAAKIHYRKGGHAHMKTDSTETWISPESTEVRFRKGGESYRGHLEWTAVPSLRPFHDALDNALGASGGSASSDIHAGIQFLPRRMKLPGVDRGLPMFLAGGAERIPTLSGLESALEWSDAKIEGSTIVRRSNEGKFELSLQDGFLTEFQHAWQGWTVQLVSMSPTATDTDFARPEADPNWKDATSTLRALTMRGLLQHARVELYDRIARAHRANLERGLEPDALVPAMNKLYEAAAPELFAKWTDDVLARADDSGSTVTNPGTAFDTAEHRQDRRGSLLRDAEQECETLVRQLLVPETDGLLPLLGSAVLQVERQALRSAWKSKVLVPAIATLDAHAERGSDAKAPR